MELPERRHLAHGVTPTRDGPTVVFITVCVRERRPILATDSVHNLLLDAWRSAAAWRIGRYVVMPDHVHLFASPNGELGLDGWVRYWKSRFTRAFGESIWQSDHWDTRMRTRQTYAEKWAYVRENPVRAGLVDRAEAWPYRGELNALRW